MYDVMHIGNTAGPLSAFYGSVTLYVYLTITTSGELSISQILCMDHENGRERMLIMMIYNLDYLYLLLESLKVCAHALYSNFLKSAACSCSV